MKRLAIVLPALFFFAIAIDAQAGARIVTPALIPDSVGTLVCHVVNASDKKEVVVEMMIYRSTGTLLAGPTPKTLGPNESYAIANSNDDARHCVVIVKKGGKKNVRVSLATTTDDDVTGAVSGF